MKCQFITLTYLYLLEKNLTYSLLPPTFKNINNTLNFRVQLCSAFTANKFYYMYLYNKHKKEK